MTLNLIEQACSSFFVANTRDLSSFPQERGTEAESATYAVSIQDDLKCLDDNTNTLSQLLSKHGTSKATLNEQLTAYLEQLDQLQCKTTAYQAEHSTLIA